MNSARTVHRLAITAYLSLIALLLLWLIWLDPLPTRLLSPVLLALLGPLLLPLRGILYGRRYTMAWTSMLILFYFTHGIAAISGGGRAAVLGSVEVILALSYFSLTMYYIRLSKPAASTAEEGLTPPAAKSGERKAPSASSAP